MEDITVVRERQATTGELPEQSRPEVLTINAGLRSNNCGKPTACMNIMRVHLTRLGGICTVTAKTKRRARFARLSMLLSNLGKLLDPYCCVVNSRCTIVYDIPVSQKLS